MRDWFKMFITILIALGSIIAVLYELAVLFAWNRLAGAVALVILIAGTIATASTI